jgi:hypothetical protein
VTVCHRADLADSPSSLYHDFNTGSRDHSGRAGSFGSFVLIPFGAAQRQSTDRGPAPVEDQFIEWIQGLRVLIMGREPQIEAGCPDVSADDVVRCIPKADYGFLLPSKYPKVR